MPTGGRVKKFKEKKRQRKLILNSIKNIYTTIYYIRVKNIGGGRNTI